MYDISGVMKAPYYLFKYNDNWSDEINIEGHLLVSHFQLSIFLDALKVFKKGEFYIGTNESICYNNREEVEERIEIIPLWERQQDTLRDLRIEDVGFAKSFFEFVKDTTVTEEDEPKKRRLGECLDFQLCSDEYDYNLNPCKNCRNYSECWDLDEIEE